MHDNEYAEETATLEAIIAAADRAIAEAKNTRELALARVCELRMRAFEAEYGFREGDLAVVTPQVYAEINGRDPWMRNMYFWKIGTVVRMVDVDIDRESIRIGNEVENAQIGAIPLSYGKLMRAVYLAIEPNRLQGLPASADPE